MDDVISRLKVLSTQMSFEPDAELNFAVRPVPDPGVDCHVDSVFVHPAVLPNGQRIKLLKTLLTSACERDCFYCPFRAGRDMRRATFRPEEFARLFVSLAHKGIAEGIFLSSGVVGGGVRTQDKLLDTADILRSRLNFRGYIHLKIMPGAEYTQVERAMHLANRVSINLEAPNTLRLARLAPHKQFLEELLQPLEWIQEIRRSRPADQGWNGRWPSSVTQFVAGGAGESDLELLTTTQALYRRLGLTRAYFSRFNPIPDTPLENQAPTLPIREQRLYQASYLLRDYGFDVEELPFEADGQLPIREDPKQAWASTHLVEQPMEINRAERGELLRIPGIGLKGVETILRLRRQARIRDLSVLRKLGVRVDRAAPFLLLDGRRTTYQPVLF
jgi:predicted DNA-binding helix-hairpin-helix protein